MEGKRINLTLADGDYRRLLDAAAADGKSPTAFAADVVKAFLLFRGFPGSSEPSKVPRAPLDRSVPSPAYQEGQGDESQIETPAIAESPKSRQQLRQEARKAKKAKK